jgi:hypothetical protein
VLNKYINKAEHSCAQHRQVMSNADRANMHFKARCALTQALPKAGIQHVAVAKVMAAVVAS